MTSRTRHRIHYNSPQHTIPNTTAAAATTASQSYAACYRALGTAELLENVLLHLPPKQILVAQRVSKFWKENIKASIHVQRSLFLRPVSDGYTEWSESHCSWMYRNGTTDKTIRPVLNPLLPEFFLHGWGRLRTFLHDGFVNPVLLSQLHGESEEEESQSQGSNAGLELMKINGPQSQTHMDRLHFDIASWRQLLIMQPPPKQIRIKCFLVSAEEQPCQITKESGVTSQDVLEGLREHWKECPQCPTCCTPGLWQFLGQCTYEFQEIEGEDAAALDILAKFEECLNPGTGDGDDGEADSGDEDDSEEGDSSSGEEDDGSSGDSDFEGEGDDEDEQIRLSLVG